MMDLKELFSYLRKNRLTIVTTVCGAFAGALMGVLAYWNGWLG